jgi:hypothetical protein
MPTIILQLDPKNLRNPNLDIRYVLTEQLIARSAGALTDDGYDYVSHEGRPLLLLFLQTNDAATALTGVIKFMETEIVLGNGLSNVPVAIEDGEEFRIVHPPNFSGTFARSGNR